MTAKDNHITEDLVEQLAIIAYEQTRIQNGDIPIPSWTGAGAMTRYNIKNDVLGVLRITVPVLIEQGWKPPAVEVLTAMPRDEDMTIAEFIEVHLIDEDEQCPSGCDVRDEESRLLTTRESRIAHVAQVLEEHMREREAEAWELGAATAWQRSSPKVNGTNYYWRSAGEPGNPHRKESSDGR